MDSPGTSKQKNILGERMLTKQEAVAGLLIYGGACFVIGCLFGYVIGVIV